MDLYIRIEDGLTDNAGASWWLGDLNPEFVHVLHLLQEAGHKLYLGGEYLNRPGNYKKILSFISQYRLNDLFTDYCWNLPEGEKWLGMSDLPYMKSLLSPGEMPQSYSIVQKATPEASLPANTTSPHEKLTKSSTRRSRTTNGTPVSS